MNAGLKIVLGLFLFLILFEESIGPNIEGEKTNTHTKTDNQEAEPRQEYSNKISIIGAGAVGTAVAFALLTQYVTDEIVLIDLEDVIEGEVRDFQDGSGFMKSPKISGGTDYKLTANSRICIIAAGARQNPGQRREELVQLNLELFEKYIIPGIKENCPNAIIIIVTNPVDIMTYVTWRLLGKKNKNKIIGSGTNLDTSRLRFLISQQFRVSPESVTGYVIGGHGEWAVVPWSGVHIAGVNVRTMFGNQGQGNNVEEWCTETKNKMVDSANKIITLKGKTSWAIGLSVANIVYSIIHNLSNIHAVSTLVQGRHGVENDEVFMSLPCVLGEHGVTQIIDQPLENEEKEAFQQAANHMINIMNSLKFSVDLESTETKEKSNGK